MEPLFVTPAGLEAQRQRVEVLEKEVRRLQSLTADAADVGGNQYHDNASYEFLLIQIRTADQRLSEEHATLGRMVVRQTVVSTERITLGSTVEVLLNGESKRLTIVGYGESDWSNGLITYAAPLGKLLIGAKSGQTVNGIIFGRSTVIRVLRILTNPEEE